MDSLRCRNCGKSMERETSTGHSLQQAKDILAKWSSSDLLDRISSLPELPAIPSPHFSSIPKSPEQPAGNDEIQAANGTKSEVAPEINAAEPDGESREVVAGQPGEDQSASGGEMIAEAETVPEPGAEPHAEASIQNPPHGTRDSSPVGPADSHDVLNSTPQTEDTLPASTSVSAVIPPEPAFRGDKIPEQSDAGTLASSLAHDGTERSEPKSPQRRKQERTAQHRQHQNRKQSTAVSSKGPSAVTKKFRFDIPGDGSDNVDAESTIAPAGTSIRSNSSGSGLRHRIDSGESVAETVESGGYRARTHGPARRRYIDEPHGSAVRGPHFQVTVPRRSSITSITGQFLAYAGVLGLTIGTAMVIYGHFGGYSEYTPTGWLVTTVAQMMLFLGVINLVSGGIEQTNDDVSQRINVLGEQLRRIEQVTEEALRGPKIPAHRYVTPDAVESDRDLVPADEHV